MTEPLVFNGIDIVIQHDHLLECFYDRMQWARHDNDFNVLLSRATAEVLARHIEKLNDERVTLLAETGATITDLEIQVERLRQERRDVTQWRDQTLAAENERLRKTLVVAYDREAESDDENAAKIAELEATNTRLREALGPMVRERNAEMKAFPHLYPKYAGNDRLLVGITAAELEAAAQAVEET